MTNINIHVQRYGLFDKNCYILDFLQDMLSKILWVESGFMDTCSPVFKTILKISLK